MKQHKTTWKRKINISREFICISKEKFNMFRRDSRVLFFFTLLFSAASVARLHRWFSFHGIPGLHYHESHRESQAATENCVWRILKLFSLLHTRINFTKRLSLFGSSTGEVSTVLLHTQLDEKWWKKNGSAFRILTHGHYFNVQSIVKTQKKLASK